MKVKYGAHSCSIVEGKPDDMETEQLRHQTEYEPDDAVAYANRMRWAGRGKKRWGPKIETKKYLYHKGTKTFPTGLLADCLGALHGDVEVLDLPVLTPAVPWSVTLPPGMSPRRAQLEAWAALTAVGRGVASLTTGSGKTLLAAMLASSYPNETVLVTTPNVRLLRQNHDEIAGFLDVPVGILGDTERDLGARVVVSTIQSLASRIEAGDSEVLAWLGSIDLWICDEAHGAAAQSYQDLSRALTSAHKRMALTATWKREDGCQRIMEGVLSPDVVYRYDYEDGAADGILTPIRVWLRPYRHVVPRAKKKPVFTSYYKERIAENVIRNIQVALDAADFVDMGFDPCLVMVKSKNQGKAIAKLLAVPYIDGEDKTSKVEGVLHEFLYARKFQALVATNILNVGVNLKPLRSAINAAAGDSAIDAEQKPGRGVRLWEGKSHFDYLDYLDDEPHFFKNHGTKRTFIYKNTFHNRVNYAKFISVEAII